MTFNHTPARLRRCVSYAAGALFCAAPFVLSVPVHAQGMPRNEAELEKELGITAAQKAKIEAVRKKYQPRIVAIQNKYKPQAQALQKQAQAVQQKMTALNQQAGKEAQPILLAQKKEVDALLTPAQKKKIQDLQARQMQMMQQQQGMGQMPMGGAPR